MFKYELGEKVKDKITKFKGVIMARIEYLTGCNQYGISPEELTKEGKRPDWEYIDENRLERIPGKIILKNQQTEEQTEKPGFDGNLPEKN